jgi:release factor glutamine methyltransferase
MTLRQAVAEAATHLAGDEHLRPPLNADYRRDAELLLLHALKITRAQLLANPGRELTPEEQSHYDHCIARRLRHEPIQYITGWQEFYGLNLRVKPAVLIPRPETEHLVEAVLQRLPSDKPLRIADIGTGSGAIAIALAAHLPQAEITATDISAVALEVAEANAREHNLSSRIRFIEADLLAIPIAAPFDAIVSNPPYIPEVDAPGLHPQVREHEPASALFGGPTGLDIYRRLIPQAHAALRPGGLLAMEIGHGQRDAIATFLANWASTVFLDDLQHIPRVALAIR